MTPGYHKVPFRAHGAGDSHANDIRVLTDSAASTSPASVFTGNADVLLRAALDDPALVETAIDMLTRDHESARHRLAEIPVRSSLALQNLYWAKFVGDHCRMMRRIMRDALNAAGDDGEVVDYAAGVARLAYLVRAHAYATALANLVEPWGGPLTADARSISARVGAMGNPDVGPIS